MPDPSRLALERALALARDQVATLEAALSLETDPFIPVKVAAHRMGISVSAAQKRAKRDPAGEKLNGRLGLRQSYVDAFLAGRMST